VISLSLLSQKDVISITTGQNIGRVDDIEFCRETALVQYLVIFGRPKFFGLLGREEDVRIPWDNVVIIGKDAVLVNNCEIKENKRKRRFAINIE